MRQIAVILGVMWLSAAASKAAIHRIAANGSAPHVTITTAYLAAVDGDTLIIGPGNYAEGITSIKRLTVIGAGFDQVTMQFWYFQNGSNRSLLEGVRLENNSNYVCYCYQNADSITVKRCILRPTGFFPVWGRDGASSGRWITFEDCIFSVVLNNAVCDGPTFVQDSAALRNCVFAGLEGGASSMSAFAGNPRFLSVNNCVFTSWGTLFNTSGTYGFNFVNNIVHDWNGAGSWGTFTTGGTVDYNASFTVPPIGTNGITLFANPFTTYNSGSGYQIGVSNLHVTAGSGLIDTGLPTLLDRNGTRSDFGIYGGPYEFVDGGAPDYPFVVSIAAPAAIIAGDSIQVNSTGRVGPRY